jgi:hypothetical protein
MTEKRSVSQILFGYLPQQTVDIRGGIWKVESWRGALSEGNIDGPSLRRELCRIARSWQAEGRDGDFVRDLEQRGIGIQVRSLDRGRGVELRPFPKVWFCRTCRRLHPKFDARCKCGSSERKGQLQFVHYCEDCAELREPFIPYCKEHKESRITFPGTASGKEILFDCPTCGRRLREGFGFQRSTCGSVMKTTVHRASSVYTPLSVVIVNPPSPIRMQELTDAGGAPRALGWVLDGMRTRSMSAGPPTADALRRQLLTQGIKPALVEQMLTAANLEGAFEGGTERLDFSPTIQEAAEEQALTIALASSESRVTFEDLIKRAPPHSKHVERYRESYPTALRNAGLARVDLIERFPILSGHFGFTRGSSEPGASHLSAFRSIRGDYLVYGDVTNTEALFLGLAPQRVGFWLRHKGHDLDEFNDERTARIAILRAASRQNTEDYTRSVLDDIIELVHSYAHRLIRLTAVHAGIERNSLSELLVPAHLGFFLYASSRGDFVLGGLQAVFESGFDQLLHEFVFAEHRCALDPGCTRGGGACIACLHLGEPSCRLFNRKLDRAVLSGPNGYLRLDSLS